MLKQSQDPLKAIESLQHENSNLKKEISALSKLKAKMLKEELKTKLKLIDGISFVAAEVDLDAQGMKDLSFDMGEALEHAVLVFGSKKSGKALLSCYISKSVVNDQQKDAGAVVRALGKYIQGGGGGQPFFATAGGKNADGIPTAIAAAEKICFA